MKFKDYLNSLVSKRKSNASSSSSSKSQHKPNNSKKHQEPTTANDCHYDICGYEDVNGTTLDDQHSRTQLLLARHAELVNTIVETRSSHDNTFPSCPQCRVSHQPSPVIPPPPPPLPPKLSFDHQTSFSNRNYSSTLATCSPRRECQHHHHHHQQQQYSHHHTHLVSSQYSTPNPGLISSSSSSLWATTTNLSKKQRSRIRTNPWIGNTSTNNRPSTFIASSPVFDDRTPPLLQPEYFIYDPTFRSSPLGLIHSESFPQTTSDGNIHLTNPPLPPPPAPVPTSSVILHQSDSGHGFSLASSRVIDSSSSSSSSSSSPPSSSSSSSPDDTSGDGVLSNGKQHYRQKKLKKKISSTSPPLQMKISLKRNSEQYFCPNTISSDGGSLTRRTKTNRISPPVTLQYRYQRPSGMTRSSPVKSPIDRKHHSHSSSSHSIDDHFSLEFEEILENERLHKQRKDKQSSTKLLSPRKSPFILPLDETNVKLSSPPPAILFSPTLTKTNSRAILKHIEEIENEIRLMKNLDLDNHDDDDDDDDECILSSHAYPEKDIDLEEENIDNTVEVEIKDERQAIYEQVDQWVEKCLQTTNNTDNPATLLHTECDHLSNTIKDYVVCVCSNDDRQISSTPEKITKLMTAFYLSSIPTRTTTRTLSFIDEPLQLDKSRRVTELLKSIHECPF